MALMHLGLKFYCLCYGNKLNQVKTKQKQTVKNEYILQESKDCVRELIKCAVTMECHERPTTPEENMMMAIIFEGNEM